MERRSDRNSPNFVYRRLWYFTAALLPALIIVGSLWPVPPKLLTSFHMSDKLFHLSAYFLLMIWYVQITFAYRQRILMAIVFIGLGIGLEFLQGLSGYRSFDWADAIANSLGVLLGLLLGFTRLQQSLLKIDGFLYTLKTKKSA